MSQALSDEEMTLIAGYVLKDLSPEEEAQFEQMLRYSPALQAEVDLMQASFTLLPHALSKVAPPPHLEDKILAANAIATNRPAIASQLEGAVRAPRQRQHSISWSKLLAGVAILTALLLGADNLRLRQELGVATKADPERVAAILQRPNSRLVALNGEAGSTATGTLLFTPGQWQEVVVSLGNLPPLPPDQVYRMWLRLNNGQVTACGEFNPNAQGAVFVKLNPPELPPQGTKATGIFVTVDAASAPLEPTGQPIMSGSI